MRKVNIFTSLFLIFLSITICIVSVELSLFGRRGPGPGFMGFITGGLIFLLSLHLFLKNLFFSKEEAVERVILRNWKVNAVVLSLLFFYVLFLEKLGFVLSAFIVISLLFAISKHMKWYVAVGSSILISIVSHILFSGFLGIGLPIGLLKFLR